MSYQVLARKWRPRTFREMVGQEHVLQALINALDHDRLHHAYLFSGTRGVGKTTIGRILAKCLNCEVGVSSAPCNECSSCIEINEGRFVDLIEVDAASRTKVEDTRDLLENVQYAPTRGRYKVYLIDEVHMLSNSSFNALLKTLEEPPPHVKFLLATTDPQKLPVTILSRCLQFNLKNMNPERIVGHLQFVLEKEMVPFEDAALWQLARSADGSMRDALSLTDQSIAFGDGKVTDADVRSMLGTIDQTIVFDVLSALISEDAKSLMQAVANLAEHAPDYSAALAELIGVLHRVAIAQALPEAVDNSLGDRQQIYDFAQQISAEDVQLYYQTSLLGRRDLPLVPDPRSGFEMVLLRMLAFKPQGVTQVPTKTLASQPAPVLEPQSPVIEAQEPSADDRSTEVDNNPIENAVGSVIDREISAVTDLTSNTPPAADQVIHEADTSVKKSEPVAALQPEPAVAGDEAGLAAENVSLPDSGQVEDIRTETPDVTVEKNDSAANDDTVVQNTAVQDAEIQSADVQATEDQGTEDQNAPQVNTPVDHASVEPEPLSVDTSNIAVSSPATSESAPDMISGDVAAEYEAMAAMQSQAESGGELGGETRGESEGYSPQNVLENNEMKPSFQAPSAADIMAGVGAVDADVNDRTLAVVNNTNSGFDDLLPPSDGAPRTSVADFTAEHWLAVYYSIKVGGLLQSTAANCEFLSKQGNELHFCLDQQQSTLYDVSHQQRLSDVLSAYFEEPVVVTIEVGTVNTETPAKIIIRRQQERQRQAEAAIMNDPLVQELQTTFGATIVEDSIKPIDE